MCRCVRCTGVFTSAYIFAYTLATGCAHASALMYVQFVHSALGDEGGGFQLVYARHLLLGVGFYFGQTES